MLRNFGLLPLYLRVSLFVTGALALVMIGVMGGTAAAQRDSKQARDVAVVQGAWQAWTVWNECFEAPSDCDAILAEVNGDGDGVKFFEDGSAYLTKDEHKYR